MLTLTSLISIALAIFFVSKPGSHWFLRLTCGALISLGTALLVLYFGINYFTGEGVNEAALYHLQVGLTGAGFGEYLQLAIAYLAILIGLPSVVWVSGKKYWNSKARFELSHHSGNHPKYQLATLVFALMAALLGPIQLEAYQLQLMRNSADTDYRRQQGSSRSVTVPGYRAPEIFPIAEKTRNLVYIYAESLELTYFDSTLFPGLTPELTRLKSTFTQFSNIRSPKGTTWTIGGMVGSQCGVPLYTTSNGNSMGGVDKFLPGAVCVGDLLQEYGYEFHYFGGADTRFAGKGNFLTSHNFETVNGNREISAKLKSKGTIAPSNAWGLYDDLVLDQAYEKFLQLSSEGKRFALYTLTLDTHHPNGHPSPSCRGNLYGSGDNKILNAVKCSDQLITAFVERILKSPYADEIVVVIASDHLAMKNSAWGILSQVPERRNLFLVADSSNHAEQFDSDKPGNVFDIAPTVLHRMGFDLRLGLGRNLFKEASLSENRGLLETSEPLIKSFVLSLWDFPQLIDFVTVDPSGRLDLDDRSLEPPVLVQFDSEFRSTVSFANPAPGQSFKDNLPLLIDGKTAFIMVDKCQNRDKLTIASSIEQKVYPSGQLCFFAGGRRLNLWSPIPEEGPLQFDLPKIRMLTR
ncbi:MAG: sulfatase-like hydrolase/transferase [Pseudomonadales bacterium]|nr:sulfatase-like hydrolase/transferase [Pseudomonadales bacterium]